MQILYFEVRGYIHSEPSVWIYNYLRYAALNNGSELRIVKTKDKFYNAVRQTVGDEDNKTLEVMAILTDIPKGEGVTIAFNPPLSIKPLEKLVEDLRSWLIPIELENED